MNADTSLKKSPLKFYLLVFALSIPFWLFGAMAGSLAESLPINLPVSSLMAVCPLLAALILVYREDKPGGIKRLLQKVFDYKSIKKKIWYVPALFLMPVIMLLSYGVMCLMGLPLPKPYIPLLIIPILFIAFFIAAVGEEVGWMGYVVDPMQDRWKRIANRPCDGDGVGNMACGAVYSGSSYLKLDSMAMLVHHCGTGFDCLAL